jgi:hypothetical protein
VVNEDLNENSHEPATKGDLRNLALRLELRLMKFESTIDQRFSAIDQRFVSIDQRFMMIDQRFTAFDASIKEYVYKLGWKFFAATIGTMGVMFTVFAMLITSSLKLLPRPRTTRVVSAYGLPNL